jgi:dolichyl-phosphate beta-glucosyltransferase
MSDPTSTLGENRSFKCTLILPTYNAADFIADTVARLRPFLAAHPDWCALFVLDGCGDVTEEKLRGLVGDLSPVVRVEAYSPNRGKGFALRRGLMMASTPYRIYTDVDLAYDPTEALKVLEVLEHGADLGVVNRASRDSQFLISPMDFPNIYRRHLMSRSFNWWLRKMLPIEILDTQAGLKGITAAAWEKIAPEMTSDGFFFDVEFLARAGAAKMRIDEVPVLVKYVDPTTVRMLNHGWAMIKDTVRLRTALRRGQKKVTVHVRQAHGVSA